MQVKLDSSKIPNISGAKVAILQASWYKELTDKMIDKCVELLTGAGCPTPERHVLPGSMELPLAAQSLIRSAPKDKPDDAVLVFGAIMKGETYHFEMIADGCVQQFGRVMLDEGVPIIVEVIPVTTVDQLVARSKDDEFNKGIEAAMATAEIIAWRRKLPGQAK